MTKREIEKCENLMHEAIRYAKESKEELEKAMSEKDKTEREILHSKGVQHYMGLQCQTLRGIGGYEYTENDKKRNENHISLFVFANFKL